MPEQMVALGACRLASPRARNAPPCAAAIRVAIGMARRGDVVVVAGRGHLDYMDFWDGEVGLRCCFCLEPE